MLVDWLPWNHVLGGNVNFGLTLFNGGSLYIDDGQPVPGRIEETVHNLREVTRCSTSASRRGTRNWSRGCGAPAHCGRASSVAFACSTMRERASLRMSATRSTGWRETVGDASSG